MKLENNELIICENDYKISLLKKMSKEHLFLNIKFLTKKEFMNSYLFSIKDEAVYYLINKYNIKIDIAKMYLDNILYIENKKYNNKKIDFLVEIKENLDKENLLIYDDQFKDYIKKFKIVVLGYDYLDKYEESIFESLNASIINEEKNYPIKDILKFDTIEEEINYVLKDILKKIESGININKIKLCNVQEEYYIPLERYALYYKLPINIPKNNNLYANKITKEFLKYYDSTLENALNHIKNNNYQIVNKIVSIVNKYTYEENKLKVKDLIINDFKNTKINNFNLKNYIELTNINYPYEDEHVYLMGFNMGLIPNAIKDESYITDDIKSLVNLKSSNDINKEVKNNIIRNLHNIKNLTITYKLKNSKGEVFPSTLISDMNLNVVEVKNNINDSYSLINDKLEYTKCLDNFYKYGNYAIDIDLYSNSIKIPYHKFNNNFNGIDLNDLKEKINSKLTLSYSSLNNYENCAFRYYLSNILKLDKYEDKFEAFIGSIFHDALEKGIDEDIDVSKEVENYITENKRELTAKERFFINKIKEDIKYTLDYLKSQKSLIKMDKSLYEHNISIDKSTKDVDVKFTGFVDKILYEELDSSTLVTIIDYKTGFVDIELKYLEYGLSMQLPIYLYLVKKGNVFNNPKFVGFYLQMILNKDINIEPNKTYDEIRKNNLKLEGYSINDTNLLERFDSTYTKSQVIKSMSMKDDGNFGTYAKVLNENEIDRIIELTEEKVNEGINNILNGKFDINPKKISNKKDGCNFCKFKDICFKTENNYIELEDKKDLSFLGGDIDAKLD